MELLLEKLEEEVEAELEATALSLLLVATR